MKIFVTILLLCPLFFMGQGVHSSIDEYKKLLKKNPNQSNIYYKKGLAYDQIGNSQQALLDYSKSIELNSKNSEALFARGKLYEKIGKYEDALSDLNKALSLNTKNKDIYFYRGVVFFRLNDNNQACLDWKKASSMAKQNLYPKFHNCNQEELITKKDKIINPKKQEVKNIPSENNEIKEKSNNQNNNSSEINEYFERLKKKKNKNKKENPIIIESQDTKPIETEKKIEAPAIKNDSISIVDNSNNISPGEKFEKINDLESDSIKIEPDKIKKNKRKKRNGAVEDVYEEGNYIRK